MTILAKLSSAKMMATPMGEDPHASLAWLARYGDGDAAAMHTANEQTQEMKSDGRRILNGGFRGASGTPRSASIAGVVPGKRRRRGWRGGRRLSKASPLFRGVPRPAPLGRE